MPPFLLSTYHTITTTTKFFIMANMSYCQMENTSRDLFSCIVSLENFEELSESERLFAERLAKYCERFVNSFEAWKDEMDEMEDDELC